MTNRQGLTLPETLIAMAILGIVLAILFGSVTQSLQQNRSSARQDRLTIAAGNHIESIRAAWRTPHAFRARLVPPSADADTTCITDTIDPDDRSEPLRLRVTVRCTHADEPTGRAVVLVVDVPAPR